VCGTSNTGNGKSFEIVGEESFHTDMDVDPSSICVPSSGLYSIDEIVDEAL
jgi:hypothetical protein